MPAQRGLRFHWIRIFDLHRQSRSATAVLFGALLAVSRAGAETVTVSPNTDAISVCRGIYGANNPQANTALANSLGIPHGRRGGNRASRYNYLNHTSCSGIDYGEDASGSYCSTVNGSSCFETCEGWFGTHQDFVRENAGRGMLVGVPSNRFDKTAGAGSRLKSTLSNVPEGSKCRHGLNGADCDQEYGQAMFDGYVRELLGLGVREFEIDNEPALWSETHRPATPPLGPLNDDDFIQMEGEAASRIGELAAAANVPRGKYKIWAGAFYSGWDLTGGFSGSNFPPCTGSGCFTYKLMQQLCGTPATGISFHWYPEISAGGCRITTNDAGQCGDSQPLLWGRANASRELWQSPFQADNGALGVDSKYQNPHVLGWLRQVNAQACPSKQFEYAITEWRIGNEATKDLWTVGLGTVDFLAGMGRAGVTEAHLWMDLGNARAQDAMYQAFQLFLSPDGTTASAVGGPDGGLMVRTDHGSDESLRSYAYKSSDGAHLWVLLLNLDWASSTKAVTVQLADGVAVSGNATVYGLNRDGSALLSGTQKTMAVSGSSFSLQVPSGARLVHLPVVSGASAAVHAACGDPAASPGNPPPPPPPPPPSGQWAASASHAPAAPRAGDPVTSSGTVQHSFASGQTVNVQTMVKDATTGSEAGRTNCSNVTVQPGVAFTCEEVQTFSAGSYKIEVGVFSPDWSSLYLWQSDADFFTVTNGVRYGFEGTTEGWTLAGGRAAIFQAYSGSSTFGHGGAYALRTQSIDSSTIQVVDKESGPLPSRGDTVTFWVAAANPSCVAYMQPFVQDGADGAWTWMGTYVAGSDLPNALNDQWLRVDVPVTQGMGEMWRIGVEMKLAPGCTYTSAYVDDVSW
jgi:glycosyl hydrolase family 44